MGHRAVCTPIPPAAFGRVQIRRKLGQENPFPTTKTLEYLKLKPLSHFVGKERIDGNNPHLYLNNVTPKVRAKLNK